MKNIVFDIYKQYLVQRAGVEGRPFRLPKSPKTLEARSDYKLFMGLNLLLTEKNMTLKELETFMVVARNYLKNDFYIGEILQYYDEIYKQFSETKPTQLKDTLFKIRDSFRNIESHAILNNMRSLDEMRVGNPPKLLKLWKGGKVCDIVAVYLMDINTIKRKSWFKVYCNELNQRSNKIKAILTYNEKVKIYLDKKLVKLNKTMKAFEK